MALKKEKKKQQHLEFWKLTTLNMTANSLKCIWITGKSVDHLLEAVTSC